MVSMAHVADEEVGLSWETITEVMARATLELAMCETLIMMHGFDHGTELYYQHGGSVCPDAKGQAWILVDLDPSGGR